MSRHLTIIGSGFFGLSLARSLAESGWEIALLEKREHPGGNAWSEMHDGIEIHRYGAHLFHTSNPRVWEFVNRFTSFTPYQHRVWSQHRGKMFPLPFSLATIAALTGVTPTPENYRDLLSPLPIENPSNLEEKALSLVGKELYEALIKGYTWKQWNTDPRELPVSVISRLPIRSTYDTRYFSDRWEGLPVEGYAAWIMTMLDHPNITIHLETDWTLDQREGMTVYSGPLDRLFNYSEGELAWRTVDFRTTRYEVPDYQGTSVINFADYEVTPTRSIEWKHFHPEREPVGHTFVTSEYSRWATTQDEPYYPVNREKDRELKARYERLVEASGLIVGGRLGNYAYLDMHQAISSGLALAERIRDNRAG